LFKRYGTGTYTEWEFDLFSFLTVLKICFNEDLLSFIMVLVNPCFWEDCWSIFLILSYIFDLTFFNSSLIVMIPFIDSWILAVFAGSFYLFAFRVYSIEFHTSLCPMSKSSMKLWSFWFVFFLNSCSEFRSALLSLLTTISKCFNLLASFNIPNAALQNLPLKIKDLLKLILVKLNFFLWLCRFFDLIGLIIHNLLELGDGLIDFIFPESKMFLFYGLILLQFHHKIAILFNYHIYLL